MKKFKNNICVKGSQSLLKAFAEELDKLGWEFYGVRTSECNPKSFNENITHLMCLKDKGYYGQYYSYSSWKEAIIHNLPEQWNEALAAASEVEEEVPEYVELLRDNCGYFSGDIAKIIEYRGSTYIVNVPNRKSTSRMSPNVSYIIDWTTPSTKEAYLKQQKELADKELLDKLIKESGLEIGNEVTWGMKVEYAKIEKFDLVKNVTLNSMKYSPGNSQLAIYLGDYYKWYSTSTDTLEVKPESKTLTLGNENIEVKISKGKIEATGKQIPVDRLQELISIMKGKGTIAGWNIEYPTAKIGCSTFTLAELEQVIETYNELNK